MDTKIIPEYKYISTGVYESTITVSKCLLQLNDKNKYEKIKEIIHTWSTKRYDELDNIIEYIGIVIRNIMDDISLLNIYVSKEKKYIHVETTKGVGYPNIIAFYKNGHTFGQHCNTGKIEELLDMFFNNSIVSSWSFNSMNEYCAALIWIFCDLLQSDSLLKITYTSIAKEINKMDPNLEVDKARKIIDVIPNNVYNNKDFIAKINITWRNILFPNTVIYQYYLLNSNQ